MGGRQCVWRNMIRNGKELNSRQLRREVSGPCCIASHWIIVSSQISYLGSACFCGASRRADRNTGRCLFFYLGLYQYRTSECDWSIHLESYSRAALRLHCPWQGTILYSPRPSRCSWIDKREENSLTIFFCIISTASFLCLHLPLSTLSASQAPVA